MQAMDDDFMDEDMLPMLMENALALLEENGTVPPQLHSVIKELASLCDVPLPVAKEQDGSTSSRRQSVTSAATLSHSRHASFSNAGKNSNSLASAPSANIPTLNNNIDGTSPSNVEIRVDSPSQPNFSRSSGGMESGDLSNSNEAGRGTPGAHLGNNPSDLASPTSAASDGTAGSPTDANKQVIPMRACVVCGQVRAGEQRKSGFKCYAHIGVPSSATFIQKVEELDFLDVKKFTLEKTPLGRGAFGRVHRATHIQSGQKFAVKILDRQQLERMKMLSKIESEINILKQLSHPNIVKIYAISESQDDDFPKLFIMMEFLEGGQVCHIDDEGKVMERIAPVRIKKWLLGMAVGLAYMHEKGFVHRDIKPENILVDRKKDSVKLTDFGVSSDLSGEGSNNELGTVEGSPAFMPPELFDFAGTGGSVTASYGLDSATVGRAQDVWALGITAFVMAFGFLPFFGKSRSELTDQVLNKPVPFPENADPFTVDLISSMLQRDILKRCTMQDVLRHPFFRGVRIVKGIPVEADPISLRLKTFPLTSPSTEKIELTPDEEAEEDATVYLPPGVFPGTNPETADIMTFAASSGFGGEFGGAAAASSSSNRRESSSSPSDRIYEENRPTIPWTKAMAALGQFVNEATMEKKPLELVVGSTYSVTLCMSDQ